MTKAPPPVPPDQQSHKGPGSSQRAPTTQDGSSQAKDTDKVGQAGNTKVNTTHQGHQQDR